MKKKRAANLEEAVSHLRDGAVVLIGGFGYGGVPEQLIEGICGNGLRNLTSAVTGNRDMGTIALGATNKMFWSEMHQRAMELVNDL